jgi:hypothetical protein
MEFDVNCLEDIRFLFKTWDRGGLTVIGGSGADEPGDEPEG